jgi:hypothetical protein
MRPFLFDWLAPSTIDLEGVTGIKTWMHAPLLLLYRGDDWFAEFIPPPFCSTESGASAHSRMAEFIEESMDRGESTMKL